jgi:hypothetical protein
MNCAVEMGSGAMIHIPSLIKFASEVVRKGHRDIQKHRLQDPISLLSFFYEKESRLKNNYMEQGPS